MLWRLHLLTVARTNTTRAYPAFADLLLRTALEWKYGTAELAPLDDALETMAHDEMVRRLERSKK